MKIVAVCAPKGPFGSAADVNLDPKCPPELPACTGRNALGTVVALMDFVTVLRGTSQSELVAFRLKVRNFEILKLWNRTE